MMLKSKKILIVAIIFIISHIVSAAGMFFLYRKITLLHLSSAYSNLNFKKSEDIKLLLKTIISEAEKDPQLAIGKIKKMYQTLPHSHAELMIKKELQKAGFTQLEH